MSGIHIIAIGNRYRGDDALGPLLADRLQDLLPDQIKLTTHDGEPASLIDEWQDDKHAILIDAVSSGAVAGTIFHFNLTTQKLPEEFNLYSTHAFGVPQAVELARVLGKLPPRLDFFGIEGKDFSGGQTLSGEVAEAGDKLLMNIKELCDA